LQSWSISDGFSIQSIVHHSGVLAAMLTNATNGTLTVTPVIPLHTYFITAYIKCTTGGEGYVMVDSNAPLSSTYTYWHKVYGTYTAGASETTMHIELYTNTPEVVYFDDITVTDTSC